MTLLAVAAAVAVLAIACLVFWRSTKSLFITQGLVGFLILTGLLYNHFWRVGLFYVIRLFLVFAVAAKNNRELTTSAANGETMSLAGSQGILVVSLLSDAVLIANDIQLGHMH
jgi:uncharacterized membrane protein